MNSTELQEIWQQLITLPPEAQREVAKLISFLRRYQQSPLINQGNQQNFREDAFIGIWQDRKDLEDSTQWVRTLRRQEW